MSSNNKSPEDSGKKTGWGYGLRGLAAGLALEMLLSGVTACSSVKPVDLKRETTSEHTQPAAKNTLNVADVVDKLFQSFYQKMFGGAVTYGDIHGKNGFDGKDYRFTLVTPEIAPAKRDERFGWRYGQFDDFFNALGLGNDTKEFPQLVNILKTYFSDNGIFKDSISSNYEVVEVKNKDDLKNNEIIRKAENGTHVGFIFVKNKDGFIEDVFYASPELRANPAKFKGFVATRDTNDYYGKNWGHVYWKKDTTVRIPGEYAEGIDFKPLLMPPSDVAKEVCGTYYGSGNYRSLQKELEALNKKIGGKDKVKREEIDAIIQKYSAYITVQDIDRRGEKGLIVLRVKENCIDKGIIVGQIRYDEGFVKDVNAGMPLHDAELAGWTRDLGTYTPFRVSDRAIRCKDRTDIPCVTGETVLKSLVWAGLFFYGGMTAAGGFGGGSDSSGGDGGGSSGGGGSSTGGGGTN